MKWLICSLAFLFSVQLTLPLSAQEPPPEKGRFLRKWFNKRRQKKEEKNLPSKELLSLHILPFQELDRTFFLYQPSNLPSNPLRPVMILLHGGGKADGDELFQRTAVSSLADREGFLAVFPNGVDAQWNDGRKSSFRKNQQTNYIDDVGFISFLIDHLVAQYQADSQRFYVLGVSNGGMMTFRLGIELGSKLTAIAPIIANLPTNLASLTPSRPIPILIMNGTQDPFVPWEGGPVNIFGKNMGPSSLLTKRFNIG